MNIRRIIFFFMVFGLLGAGFTMARAYGPTEPDEEPEIILAEATDYFIQEPKLFYLNNPVCAPILGIEGAEGAVIAPKPEGQNRAGADGPDSANGWLTQSVGRTAVHGAPSREMYHFSYDLFCNPPDEPDIISNIVADDDYVYWISNEQDALVKVSENRLDWETTPPEVVSSHTARRAELVISGDNIYMIQTGFDSTGLYRINKNSGTFTQLLTGGQVGTIPNDFQTDNEYLYWRFWTGSMWNLIAYDLATGTFATISSDMISYYPVAGNVVYIGEEDFIRSYDHATGLLSAPLYTSSANAYITSLSADGGAMYFIQQQICTPACPGAYTLYRLTFGSSTPSILYAPPHSPVRSLHSLQRHENNLFFLHDSELKRLRTNADIAPLGNMRIDGIEVTQAIQSDSNDVPLVRGKRTAVRLFVSSDGDAVLGGFARLYRLNGSGGRIDGPLSPVNLERDSAYMRVQTSPDKDNINDSFTFFLPPTWVDDPTLRLEAELNPFRFPPESTYADNVLTTGTFNLDTSGRMEARIILFEYDSGGTRYRPRYREDFLQTLSWVRRAYPLASTPGWSTDPSPGFRPSYTRLFDADLGGNVDGTNRHPECQARIDAGEGNDPDLCAAWYVICPILDTMRVVESIPSEIQLVGMVPDDAGFPRGWACGGGVSTPSGDGFRAWDTDGSYADWYAGHEIGHSQGRAHPTPGSMECGHSASDPSFPYPLAKIGNGPLRGFDLGDRGLNPLLVPRVYPDDTWSDMMSYCDNQWISDYTYEGIKTFLGSSAPIVANPDSWDGTAYLQLSGILFPDANTASLTQVRIWNSLGAVPTTPVPGAYRIRLLNGGSELAAHDFTPIAGEGVDQSALGISEFVPYLLGTTRVEITHPGSANVLWSLDISTNAPTVTNVQLVGAPTPVAGTVTMTWDGNDADGDPLTYDLLYSEDNGTSWQLVYTNLTTESAVIDTSEMAGSSQSRFKVIASDGANQGEGQTAFFVMEDKAPIVTVLSPADSAGTVFGQEVQFMAEVYDPQSGSLADADIEWRDQTGYLLGTGTEFSNDNLLIGENIITLTATNAEGLSTDVVFSFFVNDDLELPEATLTVGPDQAGWHVGPTETGLQTAVLSVNNLGDGEFTISATESVPWLEISQSGSTTPLQLTLTADPDGLPHGSSLSTTLVIEGTGLGALQTVAVPVTLSKGFIPGPTGGNYQVFLPLIVNP